LRSLAKRSKVGWQLKVLEIQKKHPKIKGIVDFEIHFWYVLAYFKGIRDVGVFVSAVVSILIFLGQTALVLQSYNGGLWSPPQRASTDFLIWISLCTLFKVVTIDLHNLRYKLKRLTFLLQF